MDKERKPTAKALWKSCENQNFQNKIQEKLKDALQQKSILDMTGVVFSNEAMFENATFPAVLFYRTSFGHAKFRKATFNDTAMFYRVTFDGIAEFQEAAFNGTADFQDSMFSKPVDFQRATFSNHADFKKATFNERVVFYRTIFNGISDFQKAKFNSSTSFSKTTFRKGCGFEKTIFALSVEFQNATFTLGVAFRGATFKYADFKGTRFSKNTEFREATFSELADFSEVTFCGITDFRMTIFCGTALFRETTFTHPVFHKARFGYAVFHDATLNGDSDFRETSFTKKTSFRGATFGGNVDFQEATLENLEFQGATVKGNAIFHRAAFRGTVMFQKATFQGNADFQAYGQSVTVQEARANLFFDVFFTNAFFGGEVSFENRQFCKCASFKGCTFAKAPVFHGCRLHQGTTFPPRENFHDVTSDHAAQAYRTLKLATGQFGARHEEARFYALEQESLRALPATPRSQKLMSWMYKLTADYGENFLKPFLWLTRTTAVFWLFYVTLLSTSTGAVSHSMECLQFTIEQLVRPFSVWVPNGGMTLKIPFEANFQLILILQIAATFQSIASLSFITLAILAIRRRFKL